MPSLDTSNSDVVKKQTMYSFPARSALLIYSMSVMVDRGVCPEVDASVLCPLNIHPTTSNSIGLNIRVCGLLAVGWLSAGYVFLALATSERRLDRRDTSPGSLEMIRAGGGILYIESHWSRDPMAECGHHQNETSD